MANLVVTRPQDIYTNAGNGLSVFINPEGVFMAKDINGNMAPVSQLLPASPGGEANNVRIIKYITLDYTQSLTLLRSVKFAYNALPTFEVEPGQLITILVYLEDANGNYNQSAIYNVVNIGNGTYGTGGTAIQNSNLFFMGYQSITSSDIEDNPLTQIYTIADLNGLTVSEYINALDPAVEFQDVSIAPRLIKVTEPGLEASYLFLPPGGLYGLNDLQTTNLDFQLLDDNITGFIPLTGTTSGNPITGDLELSQDGDALGLICGDGVDNFGKVGVSPDYYPFMENNNETIGKSAIKVQDDATYVDSENTDYRGLAGNQDFTPNITDLDYTQKIYVDKELEKKLSVVSNFNHIGVSKPILIAGAWDANIREIGNILRIDANNLILVYTGTTVPYTHGTSEFVGIATSSDNGLTWVKGGPLSDGKIINTPSEDPYIVKNPNNSNYHIYCEKKDSALTYKHAGIELFTSSDLITWTSQGVVLDKNVSNSWETTDVSSPTVIIESGTWKMYYEGRSYTGTPNAGVVCLATSSDGITWTKSGSNPLIYGSQWSNTPIVDWAIYIVPDDIIKLNNEYLMTCHTFNGSDFVESLLTSTDGITWKDKLGTHITNYTNNNYSGDGFMFFEDNILWNTTTELYLGPVTNNPYSKNIYTDLSVVGDFPEIISGNRNEFIRCAITSDSTRILGRNTKSNKGVEKVIFNDSIYNLTIDLATGVLVNGSSADIIIPKGGILNIVGTGINSWQIFENSNLLHTTGNETKTGILTFPSYYGFYLSDRHFIWHRPDLGGMTISTEDVTGSSLFIKDSNGYIGIFNTSPTAPLDVTGNGKFSGDVEITDSSKGIILKDTVLGTRHRITLVSGVLTVSTAL